MDTTLRAILQKEGLTARTIRPLTGGQVNLVYSIDDVFVLRIGQREDAFDRLQREAELLRELEGEVPAPRVRAFDQHEGWVYQIQDFVKGEKLYAVWKDLTPAEQEGVAAELAAALAHLHRRPAPYFGYARSGAEKHSTWSAFLLEKFYGTLEEIEALNLSMAPSSVEMAAEYVEEHKHVLAGGSPTLIHGDLSLVNILVNEGRLAAIMDFEYALYAPPDYELWVPEAFCLYPNDWAEADNENFTTADFANFAALLRKYSPDLFDTPHLRERLNLYQIDAALGSYVGWRKANLEQIPPETMAAKWFYLARITNFIFGHGARFF